MTRKYLPPFPAPRCATCALMALLVAMAACGKDHSGRINPNDNAAMDERKMIIAPDPHSYAKPAEAVVKHLDLDIAVDFEARRIRGSATYTVSSKGGGTVVLDTRNLDIRGVTTPEGDSLGFQLGAGDPILGRPLEIRLLHGTERFTVHYSTTDGAAALLWLEPGQTEGKQQPFLMTQSQAILARTWLPCQDSPGIRFTYTATVKVPANLMAVMSATNPTALSPGGSYRFEMKQPIPSYLMALAVGDLRFRPIGPRTGVYAEPTMIDRAEFEFADMEKMLAAAEELYGAYRWGRYDVIVLPPSFPFGGMENPRLTFATPTIITGDRSLTSLVAHELAHSWSGNLVTNATWNDFWLNEGFTVYFESRIMEKLYGKDYSDMLIVLGYQGLLETIADFGKDSPDTRLKLHLDGRDPDDGMNDIAYEKGFALLRTIESAVGRAKWDAFLKAYFDAHAFGTMTTEAFIDEIHEKLIQGDTALARKLDLTAWIYQPGLPETYPAPTSRRFAAVDAQLGRWKSGTPPGMLEGTRDWTSHEWVRFLQGLPPEISIGEMAALDRAFGFTASRNAEILFAWCEVVIQRQYEAAYPALEDFLVQVGRRKFVKPLFKAMARTGEGKAMARNIYAKAMPNYHSVTRGSVDELLK